MTCLWGHHVSRVIGQAPVVLSNDAASALDDLHRLDGVGVAHHHIATELADKGLATITTGKNQARGRLTITPLGRRIAATLHHTAERHSAAA